jgi:cyclopropane fatty-acyl-phospholipid synthase-like methyltransferase
LTKKYSKTELAATLRAEQFPRSSSYDPEWTIENLMGPNVLWLTEALTQVMKLRPGMRVLDMGCGKAVSSIFLAKEFKVQVWATDLWIKPTENWKRIRTAGLEGLVFPVHAEAHDLPFAEGFFDALVSLDAYHYFGTDDLYLAYYSRFAKDDAQIGIVVPGLVQEFTEGVPSHMASYWESEYWSLHSPDWWRNHWEKSGKVKVEVSDLVRDGWKHWLEWLEVCRDQEAPTDPKEIEMLRLDHGRNLGLTRILARKKHLSGQQDWLDRVPSTD